MTMVDTLRVQLDTIRASKEAVLAEAKARIAEIERECEAAVAAIDEQIKGFETVIQFQDKGIASKPHTPSSAPATAAAAPIPKKVPRVIRAGEPQRYSAAPKEDRRKNKPSLAAAMQIVLDEEGPMHVKDLEERLRARGFIGANEERLSYMRHQLSNNKTVFQGEGRGVWGVRGKSSSKGKGKATGRKPADVAVDQASDEDEMVDTQTEASVSIEDAEVDPIKEMLGEFRSKERSVVVNEEEFEKIADELTGDSSAAAASPSEENSDEEDEESEEDEGSTTAQAFGTISMRTSGSQ
jgi:hypothetical protein